jgi:hypothetical protein
MIPLPCILDSLQNIAATTATENQRLHLLLNLRNLLVAALLLWLLIDRAPASLRAALAVPPQRASQPVQR